MTDFEKDILPQLEEIAVKAKELKERHMAEAKALENAVMSIVDENHSVVHAYGAENSISYQDGDNILQNIKDDLYSPMEDWNFWLPSSWEQC